MKGIIDTESRHTTGLPVSYLFMGRWETITTDWTALVSLLCQQRDSILITRQSISLASSNDVTTIYLLTIREVTAELKQNLIYSFACSFCSFH